MRRDAQTIEAFEMWSAEMRAAFLRMDGFTLPCASHDCDWTPCVLRRSLIRTGRAIARSLSGGTVKP